MKEHQCEENVQSHREALPGIMTQLPRGDQQLSKASQTLGRAAPRPVLWLWALPDAIKTSPQRPCADAVRCLVQLKYHISVVRPTGP